MKEEQFYTRSTGEKVKISELETTHLINALSKSYREIFDAKDDDSFREKMTVITNLKEELHKRINVFSELKYNKNVER